MHNIGIYPKTSCLFFNVIDLQYHAISNREGFAEFRGTVLKYLIILYKLIC